MPRVLQSKPMEKKRMGTRGWKERQRLIKTTSAQIVCYDNIGNGIKDKLDIRRVGGTSHVTVDLFRRRLVLGLELSLDVGRRLPVLLCPSVLGEADRQQGLFDLLLEQVFLVQEEDDRSIREPLVVTNRVKQFE